MVREAKPSDSKIAVGACVGGRQPADSGAHPCRELKAGAPRVERGRVNWPRLAFGPASPVALGEFGPKIYLTFNPII